MHARLLWAVLLLASKTLAASPADASFYQVLELPPDCSQKDVKSAYRRLALLHHPDKNLDKKEEAVAAFERIAQAYEVLVDAKQRALYDRLGHAAFTRKVLGDVASDDPADYPDVEIGEFKRSDPMDLFKMFFGSHNPHVDGVPFLFANGAAGGAVVIEIGIGGGGGGDDAQALFNMIFGGVMSDEVTVEQSQSQRVERHVHTDVHDGVQTTTTTTTTTKDNRQFVKTETTSGPSAAQDPNVVRMLHLGSF